ncbi:hypothetical protein GCK72_014004 [Caenorhabditis remanei]|uniref:SXP/RAL-2 family protein Ani s 5-like cation-binding domain-containing protein n=1 Tax=Caenorhabditis remanei TaxID=31234 RepID=A0A6A5GQ23_CAERE|nr:hypothetical protein GCK72_014004 [Caenorhabditis remanei]KAF1757548.1 hypothetical protein GCK72_014004 [Caenorhabditis remanei]
MCSFKILIALVVISAAVMAAPNGNGYQQQGGMQRDQGGYGDQNGGFGGNQVSMRGGQGGSQGGFGGNQGGFGGQGGHGGHGGQGLPMPPFLQNVTEQARREFMAIVTNSTLTIAEIEEQSSTWAQTNGVSEQYEAFSANVTAKLEEMKQNVTSVLTNLSSVLNSLETILENEDQTLAAQRQAIEELRQESPSEVDALFFIAQEVARPQVPGGRNGTRGGNNGGFTGRSTFSTSSTTTPSG